MKSLFLFFTSLFLFCSGLSSQTYIPFPETNYVWSVSISFSITGVHSNYKFFTAGDSVVNSKTYKKCYYTKDSTIATPYSYFCLMRQDIPAKRVYGIGYGYHDEMILYDFSLGVNDTVTTVCMSWGPQRRIMVKAITWLPVNNQMRRCLEIVDYNSYAQYVKEYWIEGIGSTCGVFGPGSSAIDTGPTNTCYPRLVCAKNGSVLEYMDTELSCNQALKCEFNVSLPENSSDSFFKIYPNPNEGVLKIDLDRWGVTGYNVRIKNILSREIFNKSFQGPHAELDLTYLSKGIYFLEILNDNVLMGNAKIQKE